MVGNISILSDNSKWLRFFTGQTFSRFKIVLLMWWNVIEFNSNLTYLIWSILRITLLHCNHNKWCGKIWQFFHSKNIHLNIFFSAYHFALEWSNETEKQREKGNIWIFFSSDLSIIQFKHQCVQMKSNFTFQSFSCRVLVR